MGGKLPLRGEQPKNPVDLERLEAAGIFELSVSQGPQNKHAKGRRQSNGIMGGCSHLCT